MDGTLLSLPASEFYACLGTASAATLVDVRRQDAFDVDDRMIIRAIPRAPGEVDQWSRELPPGHRVVVCCTQGGVVSDGGFKAAYPEGRISAGGDEITHPTKTPRQGGHGDHSHWGSVRLFGDDTSDLRREG